MSNWYKREEKGAKVNIRRRDIMLDTLELEKQKLIFSVIHKYFSNYPNKEDLFQVGYIGYMKAEENYDESYGAKLSTYAYSYIYGEMRKFVREDKGLKVSREIQLLALKLEKISVLLSQSLHREATIEELSHYLQIPEEKIIEAKLAMIPIQSIDEPVNMEGREITLHDTIAEKKDTDIDMLLMLRNEISKLPQKERDLLEYRYMEDMTQTEVARELGMSQVQVSRSETKVLAKLRNRLN